ncbi:unnamed protein product, partial [Peniophora sp. CBMAI 1063]
MTSLTTLTERDVIKVSSRVKWTNPGIISLAQTLHKV